MTELPSNNLVIDIGFGTGESTIALSKMFINDIVYGIECYKPGVKKLMDNNIHVTECSGNNRKKTRLSFKDIYIVPDPWQKIKHRKRRLLNDYWYTIINKFHQWWTFSFATDNINYVFK